MRTHGPGAGLVLLLAMLLMVAAGCAVTDPIGATTSPTVTSSATTGSLVGPTTSMQPSVIRIGALLPLTGELAAKGEDCLAAMRLAVDVVNAAGGIHALGGALLEIEPADTRGDPDEAETAVTFLGREIGVCALVGGFQSAVVMPASETAEELETPFIVSSGAADEITEKGLRYTFRLCPKAEWYARDQVSFLSSDAFPGDERPVGVALLHEDGVFGSATADDQRKYLADAGIEVVDEIAYDADQADLSSEIIRIKTGGAQAVLTATYVADAVLIADTAERLYLAVPLVDAGAGTADPGFSDQVKTGYQNLFSEFEYCPGGSAYAASLEQAFLDSQGTHLSASALYAYQSVLVVADSLERAGSQDPQRLRDFIATTAMEPSERMVLPQTRLSFDGMGQNRRAGLFIAAIVDGGCIPVWPLDDVLR